MSRVQFITSDENNESLLFTTSTISHRNIINSREHIITTSSPRPSPNNTNIGSAPANPQQQSAFYLLIDSLSRSTENHRSILQQYRQSLQNNNQQWSRYPTNNSPITTTQYTLASSAQNCPPILEGHIICLAECIFSNELQKTVQQLGAQSRKNFSKDCTLFVTPYQTGLDFERAIANEPNTRIVSLQWLEECIQAKQFIEAYKPYIHYPIRNNLGIRGMNKFVISVTGFVGEERNDLKFLIKTSGAKYSGALSKKENTHLICCVPEGEKYQKALEWNIKITNKRWLYDCVSEWNYCPEDYYRDINVHR